MGRGQEVNEEERDRPSRPPSTPSRRATPRPSFAASQARGDAGRGPPRRARAADSQDAPHSGSLQAPDLSLRGLRRFGSHRQPQVVPRGQAVPSLQEDAPEPAASQPAPAAPAGQPSTGPRPARPARSSRTHRRAALGAPASGRPGPAGGRGGPAGRAGPARGALRGRADAQPRSRPRPAPTPPPRPTRTRGRRAPGRLRGGASAGARRIPGMRRRPRSPGLGPAPPRPAPGPAPPPRRWGPRPGEPAGGGGGVPRRERLLAPPARSPRPAADAWVAAPPRAWCGAGPLAGGAGPRARGAGAPCAPGISHSLARGPSSGNTPAVHTQTQTNLSCAPRTCCCGPGARPTFTQ